MCHPRPLLVAERQHDNIWTPSMTGFNINWIPWSQLLLGYGNAVATISGGTTPRIIDMRRSAANFDWREGLTVGVEERSKAKQQ